MSLAKISLALTCYRAQYPAAIYARRVRATCPRHRSHPDSISIYSHSIPEIAKCKMHKCKLVNGTTTEDATMEMAIIYARFP